MARRVLALAVATFLGSGYVPLAPGTIGSAFTCVIFYFTLLHQGLWWRLIVLVVIFALSIPAAGAAEKIFSIKDDGRIVIDEVVGMLIPLLVVEDLNSIIVTFVLFRIFDISKPFPIRRVERFFTGGTGVVLDDVVAGVYALLIFLVARTFLF